MLQPKNFHYYKFNDGTQVQMGKLKEMALDLFREGQALKIPEISKLMNLREDTVIQVIRKLCTSGKLQRQQTNRHTIYSKKSECLLAELMYPKSMVNKFKIKGRKVIKVDDGQNHSYSLAVSHQYSQGTIVYDSGE
tara:strand:- start:175 stop:582 length:408 start_codon:yes stop_codon:yes gene_type:complete